MTTPAIRGLNAELCRRAEELIDRAHDGLLAMTPGSTPVMTVRVEGAHLPVSSISGVPREKARRFLNAVVIDASDRGRKIREVLVIPDIPTLSATL
jgi:hypothetical protein